MGSDVMVEPWTCKEVAERMGVPWECCESCHDDAADWDFALLEIDVRGAEAAVCCHIAHAIGYDFDRPLTPADRAALERAGVELRREARDG